MRVRNLSVLPFGELLMSFGPPRQFDALKAAKRTTTARLASVALRGVISKENEKKGRANQSCLLSPSISDTSGKPLG